MGDLDFAHGIPPERYRCKRIRNVDNTSTCLGDANRQAIHWSLDQGKWIYSEPREEHKTPTLEMRRERNPFIRFKTMVDDGFGALNLVERRRELDRLRQLQEEDEWKRWTGDPYDMKARGPVTEPRTDAIKAARYLLETADIAMRYCEPSARQRFQQLFQDDQKSPEQDRSRPNPMLGLGAWTFCPEVADTLPSTAGIFRPSPPPPPHWLSIDWFKRSAYSPIQIEALKDLPGPRERWRDAFEDLMLTAVYREHDREPLTFEERERSDPSQQPGIDWVISLQSRAILPPLLPSYQSRSKPVGLLEGYLGNLKPSEYKEFSDFSDEIWRSNRAHLHRLWHERLVTMREQCECSLGIDPRFGVHFEETDNTSNKLHR